MEEVREKKSNKGLIAIIVVLILVITGLLVYIAYDKGVIFSKEETKEVEKKSEEKGKTKEEENVEVEIEDQIIIDSLAEKMEYLNNIDFAYGKNITTLYEKNHTKASLSEGQKIGSILSTFELQGKFSDISDAAFKELYPTYYGTFEPNEYMEIKLDTFLEEYYKVYGTKEILNYNASFTDPEFMYSEKYSGYFAYKVTGRTSGEQLLTYNYKYTKDNNKAYVYVALAMDSHAADLTRKLYTDYEKTKVYDKVASEDVYKFEIDSTNYDDFSKYKVTFAKNDDGGYYFESIENLN